MSHPRGAELCAEAEARIDIPTDWQHILEAVPQQEPFRFIDEILDLSEDHIVAAVRFSPEADFYRGHFPGNPVTPGVILVEAMAQAGVVALGLYILAQRSSLTDARKLLSVFTSADVEFRKMVRPGERVLVTGRKQFYRHRKLQVATEMRFEDGTLVSSGVLTGMGLPT